MSWSLHLPSYAAWSVHVVDLGSGTVLAAHDENQLVPTSSVATVFVLAEFASRLREGTLDPGELLDRRSVAQVSGSGLWQHLASDRLPVEDAALLVAAVSDNWATNALLALLGLEQVRVLARQWAPGGSDLLDVVRCPRTPSDPPHVSVGCAADYTAVLARLWGEHGTDGSVGQQVLRWLSAGVDQSLVGAAFEQDPLAHAVQRHGPLVIGKTGFDTGVRADVGVVADAETQIAYAALAAWDEPAAGAGPAGPAGPGRPGWSGDGTGRGEVLAALRRIGGHIQDHFGAAHAGDAHGTWLRPRGSP